MNHGDPDADSEGAGEAYFPRRYITDLFHYIRQRPGDLEVITYADLFWPADADPDTNYLAEYEAWRKDLRRGRRDRRKAYVLFQYDVDTRPHRTMDLLRSEAHGGVPANVMAFNRRIYRRQLKTTGELTFTDYPLDDDLLRRLERQGFQIGYHSNAMEQALFDPARALEIFDADMRALRERFDVRFFSAHGGVVGPNGLRNRDLTVHPAWANRVRWVHNGHTVRFRKSFSDGGHNSKKIHPGERDLRDFVRQFRPGERYRIILHPQYYDVTPKTSSSYGGTAWYDELLAQARRPGSPSLWDGVIMAG